MTLVADARQVPPEAGASVAVGMLAFAGLYMPMTGFGLAVGGIVLSAYALRRCWDSKRATVGLCASCLALAVSLAGFVYSLMTGLDGIITAPAPP